jgi:protein-S-isoprenylcysteine O-methyltransferase Ste14
VSRLLVALQFGLIAVMVLRTDPSRFGIAFAALGACGLAVGLWAISANRPGNFNIRPEPKQGGRLVTGGPYRWIRHPMYLAVLVFMSAFVVAGDAAQGALWVLLAIVLAAKAVREERGLVLVHPGYAAYRERTRAILPFVF